MYALVLSPAGCLFACLVACGFLLFGQAGHASRAAGRSRAALRSATFYRRRADSVLFLIRLIPYSLFVLFVIRLIRISPGSSFVWILVLFPRRAPLRRAASFYRQRRLIALPGSPPIVAGFMFGMHHVLDDETDKLYNYECGKIMGNYITSAKQMFVLTPFGSRWLIYAPDSGALNSCMHNFLRMMDYCMHNDA